MRNLFLWSYDTHPFIASYFLCSCGEMLCMFCHGWSFYVSKCSLGEKNLESEEDEALTGCSTDHCCDWCDLLQDTHLENSTRSTYAKNTLLGLIQIQTQHKYKGCPYLFKGSCLFLDIWQLSLKFCHKLEYIEICGFLHIGEFEEYKGKQYQDDNGL